jgi:pimeloyl-ACP methyl ester carboxylesterase
MSNSNDSNGLIIENAVIVRFLVGGQIAIDFTVECPEKVKALILVAPGLNGYQYQPTDRDKEVNQMLTEMIIYGKRLSL